jgi:hypothetical protein
LSLNVFKGELLLMLCLTCTEGLTDESAYCASKYGIHKTEACYQTFLMDNGNFRLWPRQYHCLM